MSSISLILILASALMLVAYLLRKRPANLNPALEEVADGDALFWLVQSGSRDMPCTVTYHFDQPLDEVLVRGRLKHLVEPYKMCKRNMVEVDGLPYWQAAEPDWRQNFRVLSVGEDLESVRMATDRALSQANKLGEGIPLFRAYLSADRYQLTFMWHHVISDFEGMFNKHARHLFLEDSERTQFGYQINDPSNVSPPPVPISSIFKARPLGFVETGFDVRKKVLPIADKALYELGRAADLPMSDIFSFITARAVTRYHEAIGDPGTENIRPVVSPLSLRPNSLAMDEGNNRVAKQFPLVFPLEEITDTYQRIVKLVPATGSYERAGRMMKVVRRFSILEKPFHKIAWPDYISNYFPLADRPLRIGNAKLISHDLRVPMVPYERSKFAWSSYNGNVQLFLHTDPELIDADLMAASFEEGLEEVLLFLRNR